MIACNDDGRDLFSKDELDEDFIKGAYGFRGRDGAVIDIACNEEGIDLSSLMMLISSPRTAIWSSRR